MFARSSVRRGEQARAAVPTYKALVVCHGVVACEETAARLLDLTDCRLHREDVASLPETKPGRIFSAFVRDLRVGILFAREEWSL